MSSIKIYNRDTVKHSIEKVWPNMLLKKIINHQLNINYYLPKAKPDKINTLANKLRVSKNYLRGNCF